jgi:hypothetical protein
MAQSYDLNYFCKQNMSAHQSSSNLPPPKVAFNKLAQLGTGIAGEHSSDSSDINALRPVTQKSDTGKLEKRAKAKYFTFSFAAQLLRASNGVGVLSNSYRRTLECGSYIIVGNDGRAVSHYCKNRWCVVCARIRTAVTVKAYAPILAGWEDAYFVTLTVPNVTGNALRATLEQMRDTFTRIQGRFKKQAQRGKASIFVGVRKLECTANVERDDYHPHLHCIVRGKASAYALRRAWLNDYPGVKRIAQDVRKADTGSIKELLKYAAKLAVTVKGKADRVVYADAMNVVFEAMRGMRTLQSFGFRLPKIEQGVIDAQGNSELDRVNGAGAAVFEYEHSEGNWFDMDTGEVLIPNWAMPESIRRLSGNIVVRPGYRKNGNRAFAAQGVGGVVGKILK